MEELKTLKDMKATSNNPMWDMGYEDCMINLKNLAIKWVKKWESEPYDVKNHAYTLGKIAGVMEINNITEENLNDKF